MKRQRVLAAVVAIAASITSVAVAGQGGPKIDIPGRARGSGRVVVATATSVTPRWRTNEHGDQLIVSLVGLQVDETLKGDARNFVWMDLEGGTLNGVTLHVSSLPELKPGERAVFFLDETSDGSHVPHLKGKGILKLDDQNHAPSENLQLDDIRRQIHDSGK
jgi:hypothetical protein